MTSQGIAINNIIATDITAAEDDVIEIDFGNHLQNVPFILAWVDSTGQRYALPYKTGSENLIIPIGSQNGWKGEIGLVGLSINNVEATFRKTGIEDVWSSFLAIYPMSPGSINFTGSYFIVGKPLRWICGGLMIFLAVFIYVFKRRWDIALLLGFTIAWGVYDLRSSYNRWGIMHEIAENEWQIPVLKEIDVFLPKAKNIIGPDGSWSKEQLPGFLNSYCIYELGDLKYFPSRGGQKKNADYIITTEPRKRQVVLNEGPYYLVSNN